MNKESPEPKRDNSMKKNKGKLPAVKAERQTNINAMMDNICGEFDKMSPEEKEKFKQQTLENLRGAIRAMVEGHKGHVARSDNRGDSKNAYALNPPNRSVAVPQSDSSDIYEAIKQKPLNDKETELLRCRIAEYLKNFVIFGYDMNGNRILITNSKNTQDNDSLVEMAKHIPAVLFQMFNGRQPDIGDLF